MSHIARTFDLGIETEAASRDLDVPARPANAIRRLGWRKLLLAGAALVAIGAAGDFARNYWTTGRFEVSTDDAYVKADTTVIAPKVSGYISEVLVSDNQAVKAGQSLARIDDRDYQVAVSQARADVASAEAQIGN